MNCSQDLGADSTIENKEGMTAVDVAPITVLHVFKKDVAKVPPLEEQQVGHCKMTKVIGNNFCLCWFRPKKVKFFHFKDNIW